MTMTKDQIMTLFLTKCSKQLNTQDLQFIKDTFIKTFINYDFIEKTTELTTIDTSSLYLIDMYIASKRLENCSEGTINQYRRVINMFLQFINKPIATIITDDIRYFLIKYKEARNISATSLNNTRQYLFCFFTWCTNNDYIAKNPCANIKPIKEESKERTAFTDVELELIRKSCNDNARNKAIIETLYSTGCRVSELVNIKISDIDFINRKVKLFGKGKKWRTTGLSCKAIMAIQDYLNTKNYDSEYVFTAIRAPHNVIGKTNVEKLMRQISAETNIEVFPHRFRHTMATTAIANGMPVEQVQIILGHESIDTTQKYAHVNKDIALQSHRRYVL